MANLIVPYNGGTIPSKWELCDGQNGTPDLRDRFVKCVANDGEIGIAGGSTTHTHITGSGGAAHAHELVASGSHVHACSQRSGVYFDNNETGVNRELKAVTHGHTTNAAQPAHTHSIDNASNMPEYYKLVFIMGEEVRFDFPIGSIVMFNGWQEELPEGWALCDGQNGTPDLRNRFILGAANDGEAGNTGGNSTHIHSLNNTAEHNHAADAVIFSHRHDVGVQMSGGPVRQSPDEVSERADLEGPSHTHNVSLAGGHTHTVSSVNNEPPYIKLAYIKRVA